MVTVSGDNKMSRNSLVFNLTSAICSNREESGVSWSFVTASINSWTVTRFSASRSNSSSLPFSRCEFISSMISLSFDSSDVTSRSTRFKILLTRLNNRFAPFVSARSSLCAVSFICEKKEVKENEKRWISSCCQTSKGRETKAKHSDKDTYI